MYDNLLKNGNENLPSLRPTPLFHPGTEILEGRFEIRRLLGRGGTGVVYTALDRTQGIDVALKMLHWTDPTSVLRLKREFRLLADVVHTNLVGLQELFLEGDLCFFTMDLVHGNPFLDLVRQDPSTEGVNSNGDDASLVVRDNPNKDISDERAIQNATSKDRGEANRSSVYTAGKPEMFDSITGPGATGSSSPSAVDRSFAHDRLFNQGALRFYMAQLVKGVDALHRAGILHRDLKPSNVLINDKHEVVILDFGIARDQLEGERDSGVEQGVCGTPAYMAPEQADGRNAQPASDWYAVGVILYEALTGRLPFWGSSRQIMDGKQDRDPIAPHVYTREAPEDLSALCMDMLARDPAARPKASEILARLGGLDKVSLGQDKSSIVAMLVGREPQCALLKDAFEKAQTGQTVLVLLSGKAGMGKTALLRRFAADLRKHGQAVVISGRCYENETVPYKALDNVIDALHQYLSTLDRALIERLCPEEIGALGLLFPLLAGLEKFKPASRTKKLAVDSLQMRNIAYQALKELLRRMAQMQPLVLTIDDLQWGDVDSARLIKELLTPPDCPPFLLVASYRSEEGQTNSFIDFISRRDELAGSTPEICQIPVQELNREQALRLAESLLGRHGATYRAQAETVCRESDLSPLLIKELADHVTSVASASGEMPSSIRWSLIEVIRSRLTQVPEAISRLFELVCVARQPISQLVLAEACGLEVDLQSALRTLRTKRLISLRRSPNKTHVDAYHNRVRDAVLENLPAEKTRAHHLLLAESYQRSGDRDPYVLAIHYRDGGNLSQAGAYAEMAGDLAAGSLAFDRAAQMYRMALELKSLSPDDARSLQIRLAEALSNAGRGGDAAPLFLQAAESARFTEALSLRRRAAEQWLVSGNTESGMSALGLVMDAVALSLPATPLAALIDLLLTRAKLRIFGIGFKVRREQEIPPLDLLRVDVCNVSTALGFVNTILGTALQARHLWLALRAGEPFRIAIGLCREAIFNSTEGSRKQHRVRTLQLKAQEITRGLDNPIAEAYHYLVEGQSSYMFGRWRASSIALETAEKILMERCTGVAWELNSSRFFWGNCLVFQGRWKDLGRRLEHWLDDARARSDVYASSSLQILETRCVTLAAGDVARAREEIDAAMALWASKAFGVQAFLAEISKIQLDIYACPPHVAVERVERVWPVFSRSMMRRVQLCRVHLDHHSGYVYLALAASCEGQKRGKALRQARRYARRLDKEGIEWAGPFAAYIRAAIQYLQGNPEAAIDGLRHAVDGFEQTHMSLYRAAAQRRLGQLISGDQGQALITAAEAAFTEQGVLDPPRLANMMAPGFF